MRFARARRIPRLGRPAAIAVAVALVIASLPTGATAADRAPRTLDRSDAPSPAVGLAAPLAGVAPGRTVALRFDASGLADPMAGGRLVLDHEPRTHQIEGVEVVRAPDWHSLGLGGAGVKIAIVDVGFGGYEDLLGTALPATVATRSFRANGSMGLDPHGTAVAEIVHAVAPQAELLLVTIGAESDFDPVVDFLIAEGVDVVNTSLGFTAGPFDGTSPVSRAVARAVDAGIVWVASAGNEAQTHWGGTFVDVDGDGWAEVTGDEEINGFDAANGAIDIDLSWTDRDADLAVCLYDVTTLDPVELACADTVQLPGDRPVESIRWLVTDGPTSLGVGVFAHEPTSTRFDVFVEGTSVLDHPVAAGSIPSPADVAGVITVGAVPWDAPTTVEPYSSRGPTAGGIVKPDLVAPDRVSTTAYGAGAFAGTSAAAPHVAGLAALYLGRWPLRPPAAITKSLADLAVPLAETSAKSTAWGWGRASAADFVPLPPGGRFIDDDGTEHEPLIEAVAESGLTAGCAVARYCPADPVTRWHMALFLTRAATAAGVPLPDGSPQGFEDIDGFPANVQVAINQLAQLGITSGTSPTTFSPDGSVPRWMMALFLTRLETVLGVPLPDGSDQGFTDIDELSEDVQTAINQLAQLGITNGTGPGTFSPEGMVTRAQMAAFIARTLGLEPLPPPPPVR